MCQLVLHYVANRARANWGKSLGKVKLVNNLNSFSKQTKNHLVAPSYPLVPFYPPAFSVPYIAMSRDEYERKPVCKMIYPPILFDVLSLAITDSSIDQHALNKQWVFRIELGYGDIKWVIKRTVVDFYSLHLTLKFKAGLSTRTPHPPPFPGQLAHLYHALTSMPGRTIEEEKDDNRKDSNLKRREQLEEYLKDLIKKSHMVVNYDLCEFLEISAISITRDMGWKGKEGYLENRLESVLPSLCQAVNFTKWNKEWVILRDSYMAFCKDIGSTSPTDVLLFDRHFKANASSHFLTPYNQHHITIQNGSRKIDIKGPATRVIEDWMASIKRVQNESPWVKHHRYDSFAPIRSNAKAKWFVDGHDYYEAIAEAILAAKSEIYIADWWLYLKRPPEDNEHYRLDRLLEFKAKQGVMIYIVIYKEIEMAVALNSGHTKNWLQGRHPNIFVQRHPDHNATARQRVFFWAHHEKMLIVDYRLAFIGGLDLCFGRYDTHSHRLADYPAKGHDKEIFPGQDYSNPRVKDFANVAQYNLCLIDKKVIPRMPWHDVALGMVGPPARDVARHFVQRWNHVKSTKGHKRTNLPFLTPKGEFVSARDETKFNGTCRVQIVRSSAEWSQGITREYSICSAYMEVINKAKHFVYIENQFFVSATHEGDKLIKNKIGQVIVERIKRAHKEAKAFRVYVVMPLAPSFEGEITSSDASVLRLVMHHQYRSISRGGNSILEKLRAVGINPEDYISFYSLRTWDKIKSDHVYQNKTKAKAHNGSADENSDRANSSTDAVEGRANGRPQVPLRQNSKKGRQHKKTRSVTSVGTRKSEDTFGEEMVRSATLSSTNSMELNDGRMDYVTSMVYIHSKLLIADDRIVVCGSANLNDRSQLGNRDSEIAMVIEDTDMVDSKMNGKEYKAGRFAYTLRTHLFKEHIGLLTAHERSTLNDMRTNLPYGHSKRTSMADSTGVLNIPCASPQTHDDKTSNDIADSIVMDPLDDDFYYNYWHRIASRNTQIYRSLFRCVPDDTVTTFEQHKRFVPDPTIIPEGHIAHPYRMSVDEIEDTLSDIQGKLVHFPTKYLREENLQGGQVKGAVTPMHLFT
ncbi:hypothetical protein INT43_006782 [Umbelopsis isabellina]|uniref:Phospholipase n=1 Tax=Mortierella isabellina TaxID=91625 RepID=A0A8H7UFF3_MORIS|nr:hypothetical protein INT43_006782 [Umbelopsis isabellina]